MKFNTEIIKFIGLLILIFCLILFAFLWYRTNNKLKVTNDKLTSALANVAALQTDKENLINYNLQKEEQLKLIEEEYQEVLGNIPSDLCGDVKPSTELLQFFRKNK